MDYIKDFDKSVSGILNQYMKKPTLIKGVVHLLLILYAARLAPSLPKTVLRLFENQYFKLFIFALILWTAQVSPSTSLLIAIAFMVTINYATGEPLWDFNKPVLELLENTTMGTVSVNEPSKEQALDSASQSINVQMQSTPVINGVVQQEETIVIKPSIVETPNGLAVINPTVVVSPALVQTSEGEKIVVVPEVTKVTPPPEPVSPAEPAPASPAPAPAVEPTPVPAPTEGCYPSRKYDMSQVEPSDFSKYQEWTK